MKRKKPAGLPTHPFEVIADPHRRRILDLLKIRERTAGELNGHFTFSWPALSQHLKILKRAGLVRVRREGRFMRYRLSPRPIQEECVEWILSYSKFWSGKLQRLKSHLEAGPQTGSGRRKRHVKE